MMNIMDSIQKHFKTHATQQGAISPFMFGMLMSITFMSTLMQYQAQKRLEGIQERKHAESKRRAQDIKHAVENAILTENVNDARNGEHRAFDLNNLRAYLSSSTGQTQAGQDIIVHEIETEGRFDTRNKRIIIQSGDNALVRQQAQQHLSEEYALKEMHATTVVIDTDEIRQQQIVKAKEYLEREAAQAFKAYINNGYTFPDNSDYDTQINQITNLKDAWGQPFKYEKTRC